MGDGVDGDDDSGNSDSEEELDGEDGVGLMDERPTEFGALKHHRVMRAVAKIRLQVGVFPHRTPHLPMINCHSRALKNNFCTNVTVEDEHCISNGMKWLWFLLRNKFNLGHSFEKMIEMKVCYMKGFPPLAEETF